MITQSIYSTIVPQQLICELVGGGVAERYPDLHFALIEFNAHWLASLVGAMDKCWITGIGQDADWWLGYWDADAAARAADQHGAAVPAEREVAVPAACRASTCAASSTSRSRTTRWRSPAGTSRASRPSCGATTTRTPRARSAAAGSSSPSSSSGVPADERDAMLGGTLGGLLGFKAPVAA